MEKKIIEFTSKGLRNISPENFQLKNLAANSTYLYEIISENRTDVIEAMRPIIGVEDLEYLNEPDEHIRFETVKEETYGELAFFSAKSDEHIKYIACIINKNVFFIVHSPDISIANDMLESFKKIIDSKKVEVEIKYLLYVLIVELLTYHGKLLLTIREKIEGVAKNFNKDFNEIDPDDFLKSKSYLSDFAQVIEKIHFSLYFPPVNSILDTDSPYRKYFEELLKTVDMLKVSLDQAERRLDSLHNHFLLLLQEKSNKRINFLTIIQSIFAPLTLIVGVYGMNFLNMPELNYKYAYFIVLGAMGVISLIFMRYFYKNGWFE